MGLGSTRNAYLYLKHYPYKCKRHEEISWLYLQIYSKYGPMQTWQYKARLLTVKYIYITRKCKCYIRNSLTYVFNNGIMHLKALLLIQNVCYKQMHGLHKEIGSLDLCLPTIKLTILRHSQVRLLPAKSNMPKCFYVILFVCLTAGIHISVCILELLLPGCPYFVLKNE